MPPTFKFTREEILNAAFCLVREKGWNFLTTRAIAERLGSSARPIYSFFSSIDDLEEALVKMSVDLLFEHMIRERTGDPWIDHGIGYVIFAREEKYLFRGSNNEKNIKHFKAYGEKIWNALTRSLDQYPPFKGLSEEQVYKIQATRWLLAHGLAFQVSNPPPDVWDEDTIMTMIQEGSHALYEGLKIQFSLEEKGKNPD